MSIARLTYNGRAASLGLVTAGGVAPSQVGSLTPGAPTLYTIPVTYTAATGTATITYAGYTSPHGASTWTLNGGSFSSTGGAFVGLTPGTNYDFKIVATNASGSSTTQYLTGVTTPAGLPAATGAANRMAIRARSSSVAVGTVVPVDVYPNGTWNGETIGLAVSGGTATIGGSVTTTSGASAKVTINVTPTSTGELYITPSNSGSLYVPYPAPLNVFAASSGTARTLSIAVDSGMDQQPYAYDSLLITPAGLGSMTGAVGVGEGWFNVSAISGATGGLFMRFYDALSSGASKSTVGSGTALHSTPVQVYGAFSATGVIRVMLPASIYWYFADVATDAAMTNPVRIQQRFGVGHGIGVVGRSQEAGLTQWWNDQTASGETWDRTVARYTGDYRYANGSGPWNRSYGATNADGGTGSEPNSAGAQYAGKIISDKLGVLLFIAGEACQIGGGIDEYIAPDGSFRDGFTSTILGNGNRKKFHWLWGAGNAEWDGVDSAYPTENNAETKRRLIAASALIPTNYPFVSVISWGMGGTGRPNSNGTAILGYGRKQDLVLSYIEPVNPMVVSKENYCWAAFSYSHANNSSKRLYIEDGIRRLLTAELTINLGYQTSGRGPTLSVSGHTIATGSRVVRLFGKFNGSTALSTVRITQVNPTNTIATGVSGASDLATLVTLYATGGYSGNGLSILLSALAINYTSLPAGADFSLDCTLAGSSGVTYEDSSTGAMPSGFSAHLGAELHAGNGTGYTVQDTAAQPPPASVLNMIVGNAGPSGWNFGMAIRPAIDLPVVFA